ncbi:MAG: phage tail sheath C-terminal domain-containing protein [Candidatus Thorarchaeota archaeon]
MANVSPGVFTKIVDLSTFIQVVPSTIGFMCGFSEKGRDNELVLVGSRSDFISEWGEPNITDFGKNYGQGPYIAYNHLGESGALYWIRLLSENATYANIRLDATLAAGDATTGISITYVDSVNTKDELATNLATAGNTKPILFLYPIGRGAYYNALGIRLTEHSNPTLSGVYVLDIYEKQSDGDDVIIESFDVSLDPNAVDNAGDSIFIGSILETYSSVLRATMTLSSGEYTDGYKLIAKNYDKEIGTVAVTLTSGSAIISDNKQDFSDWETDPETGNSNYVVVAKDAKGIEIWGWLGAAGGVDNEEINVFQTRSLTGAVQGWNGSIGSFDANSTITYFIRESHASAASAFTSSVPKPLRKGSDGDLRNTDGSLDTTEAETLLEQGYSGLIDDQILDPENIYFTLVYDAGYPSDVKTAISTLCQTRRDCVGILDNGDNSSVNIALSTRTNTNTFNNYYVALYEPFNKVSDPFTGEDVWFSPIYHMSYLIPRNDNVAEIWYAAAGFQRAAIDSIKELRYNPRLGQRDQMYLKQLNPIVKFAAGYVVWGQLTSQSRASALQDLNIVRLVLYCKRAIEQFCRNFVFEQNDEITWGQVSTAVVEFLEVIKNRRGLDSYSVDVGATDYERKSKRFHVNVILQPTRVVEQIELNFFIQ